MEYRGGRAAVTARNKRRKNKMSMKPKWAKHNVTKKGKEEIRLREEEASRNDSEVIAREVQDRSRGAVT